MTLKKEKRPQLARQLKLHYGTIRVQVLFLSPFDLVPQVFPLIHLMCLNPKAEMSK